MSTAAGDNADADATLNITLASESETRALGAALGDALLQIQPWAQRHFCIGLQGDLGAGKTLLADALVRALGADCGAQSPTYALVHNYSAGALTIWHLDLYRIGGADDLPALGLDQYESACSLWLVEWFDRAEGYLRADIGICLDYPDMQGEAAVSCTDTQRVAHLHAYSKDSKIVLQQLHQFCRGAPQ